MYQISNLNNYYKLLYLFKYIKLYTNIKFL